MELRRVLRVSQKEWRNMRDWGRLKKKWASVKVRAMVFHIITIFPESFESYLGESILARAIKSKKNTD